MKKRKNIFHWIKSKLSRRYRNHTVVPNVDLGNDQFADDIDLRNKELQEQIQSLNLQAESTQSEVRKQLEDLQKLMEELGKAKK